MDQVARPRLAEPPHLRVAELRDDEALAAFRCSGGRWFQQEVEDFITTGLPGRLGSETLRTLVFHLGDELVAVGAHQPATLVVAEEPGEVQAAHLVVVAITNRLQTALLSGASRLSDHVIQSVLQDALRVQKTDVAFSIVAIENQRSLAMCERNGLTSQTTVDAVYARATGRFATA